MRKTIGIVAINVLAGLTLGAFTAAAISPFAAALGPIVGSVIGLATSPVVAVCVHRKRLCIGLTIVYGLTTFVTILAVLTRLPAFTVLLSILALSLSSACIRIFLADAPQRREESDGHFCDGCGYNLTGNTSGRCPECGAPVLDPSRYYSAQESRAGSSKRHLFGLVLSLGTVTSLLGLTALQRVVAMRPAEDVDGLIRQLADGEALVHEPAINELVKRGKAPLLEALKDPNPTVRRHAVKGLLRLGDPSTVPELISVLDDTDPWARMWAAGALGNLGDRTAICPLLQRRNDPAPFVRNNVKRALQLLDVDPQAEPADYGCEDDHSE
jgi:hypothetical protein